MAGTGSSLCFRTMPSFRARQDYERPPIETIVRQHVEAVTCLSIVRATLLDSPHVKLHHLDRLDNRLTAHLDGLAVAGEFGWRLCESALADAGRGEIFTGTVRALEDGSADRLDHLLAVAEAAPALLSGVIAAFNWVSAQWLQGAILGLLNAKSATRLLIGIAACRLHQVDPGVPLAIALTADDVRLRAFALRAASECGRIELLPACLEALDDADTDCRFHAASAAALLGDRQRALRALESIASERGPTQMYALRLLLKLLPLQQAAPILNTLSGDPTNRRTLLKAVGAAGDPYYIPWLIDQMADLEVTRLAGESFSMITGADLAWLDLERKPPAGFESGPNDDPTDDDVGMDDDENLPWPDPERVARWWHANEHRFQAGHRYFMGAPPSPAHCVQVLRDGYQRQRMAAAQYLCLLQPGTKLFNCAAPAWRQRRWLDRLA